jgi:hypothetical protein
MAGWATILARTTVSVVWDNGNLPLISRDIQYGYVEEKSPVVPQAET